MTDFMLAYKAWKPNGVAAMVPGKSETLRTAADGVKQTTTSRANAAVESYWERKEVDTAFATRGHPTVKDSGSALDNLAGKISAGALVGRDPGGEREIAARVKREGRSANLKLGSDGSSCIESCLGIPQDIPEKEGHRKRGIVGFTGATPAPGQRRSIQVPEDPARTFAINACDCRKEWTTGLKGYTGTQLSPRARAPNPIQHDQEPGHWNAHTDHAAQQNDPGLWDAQPQPAEHAAQVERRLPWAETGPGHQAGRRSEEALQQLVESANGAGNTARQQQSRQEAWARAPWQAASYDPRGAYMSRKPHHRRVTDNDMPPRPGEWWTGAGHANNPHLAMHDTPAVSARKQDIPSASAARHNPHFSKLDPDMHGRDELLSKCETLQRVLDDRTLERDDLQRNVELLSMQSGNATFDFSSILSERLFQAESQLARLRTTSKDLENERDNLREDFVQFRQLKRTSDKSWKEEAKMLKKLPRLQSRKSKNLTAAAEQAQEKDRNVKLERDLRFYQEQSAIAMQDRDRAQSEAEQLREATDALGEQLASTQEALQAKTARTRELERRHREKDTVVRELTAKAAVAEKVPGLTSTLQARTAALELMTSHRDRLQAELDTSMADCKATKQQAEYLATELQDLHARFKAFQAEHSMTVSRKDSEFAALKKVSDDQGKILEDGDASLQAAHLLEEEQASKIKGLDADLASVVEKMEGGFQEERSKLQQSLDEEKVTTSSLREEAAVQAETHATVLEQLTKAQEASASAEERAQTNEALVADMQAKLQQVTNEKIELLMEAAELKEQLREETTMDRTEEGDSWSAWPWKPQYGKQNRGQPSKGGQSPAKSPAPKDTGAAAAGATPSTPNTPQ